jgi:hypothetical protein
VQGWGYANILNSKRNGELEISGVGNILVFRNLWDVDSNPWALTAKQRFPSNFSSLFRGAPEKDIYQEQPQGDEDGSIFKTLFPGGVGCSHL